MVRPGVRTLLTIVFLSFLIYYSVLSFLNNSVKQNTISHENLSKFSSKLEQLEKKVYNELEDSKTLLKRLEEKLKSQKSDVSKEVKKFDKPVIAILVIACNRVTVTRCLDNLLKYRPSKDLFPIIVSQDCDHVPTFKAISKYVTPDSGITVTLQPNQTKLKLAGAKKKMAGYYYISRHYKYALDYVFKSYEQAIIVEDDLDISPDFYEYFTATLELLIKDESLWCVSAWNDNGKRGLIDLNSPDILYRSDFFPGLGWMVRRNVGRELLDKWPDAFWDDWVRDPAQRKGRACIRPEISRTITFGKVGVSNGMYYETHLKHIILNKDFIPFTQTDITYLLKENYDPWWDTTVSNTFAVSLEQLKNLQDFPKHAVRIMYHNSVTFKAAAKVLGLMEDFRSGVPRTAYRGVVPCFHKNLQVYISRNNPVTEYDPKWS